MRNDIGPRAQRTLASPRQISWTVEGRGVHAAQRDGVRGDHGHTPRRRRRTEQSVTAPTKAGASRFGTFNQTTRAMASPTIAISEYLNIVVQPPSTLRTRALRYRRTAKERPLTGPLRAARASITTIIAPTRSVNGMSRADVKSNGCGVGSRHDERAQSCQHSPDVFACGIRSSAFDRHVDNRSSGAAILLAARSLPLRHR
jgi:hypothetical protein